MGVQSNVVIKSNVYVNRSESKEDKEFLRHVRGFEAISQIPYSLRTPKQQNEFSFGTDNTCGYDKSRQKDTVRGSLYENGESVLIVKCDQRDCDLYQDCSRWSWFKRFERKPEEHISDEDVYTPPDFSLLRYLDAEDKIIYLKTVKQTKETFAPFEIIIKPTIPETTNKTEDIPSDEIIIPEGHSEISVPEKKTEYPEVEIQEELPEETSDTNFVENKFIVAIEYEKIDNPKKIIESEIADRIIVNAGPGTGKTYSVIKRLDHIIKNELANLQNVIVLCYSKSAVGVIKKRINNEIEAGILPVEARQLFDGIRTFDSFVTYMLSDVEIEGTINCLNYDERIERFIKEVAKNRDCFSELEYIIIDEMQDLVGARARMVKTILEKINCGFLLLGDICQSIYDFLIQDESELNSYRYYKWLNSFFEEKAKRYELTKNVRQQEEFAMISDYIRQAILSDNIKRQTEALTLCADTIMNENYIGNIRNQQNLKMDKNSAILCRNNAEVSVISSELFAMDIPHRVSKRAQHIDLVSWIAEILSTYTESKIGISAFKERVFSLGYDDAETKWTLLKSVAADENDNVLDIRLFVKSLVSGKDLPIELDLASSDTSVVSTIHRSKGREYNNITLIAENFSGNGKETDEIKVAYVALTRVKSHISFCSLPDEYNRNSGSFVKKYFEKVKRVSNDNRSRFYSYMWNPRKKSKYPFCSNIEVGLSGDIIPCSFVTKKKADEIQRNFRNTQVGDELVAKLLGGNYWLYNKKDELMGCLSSEITLDIRCAIEELNPGCKYYGDYQMPSALSGIYVNNIVTIANTKFNDVIAEPYNKSGLWLGVEISGFAKTDWS